MDSSFRDQESTTQKNPKRFFVGLILLASIVKRLAELVRLTEQEREEAGIHIDRLGDE